ncbi:IclR family transcriptional regulator [Aquibium sp. LZ166]|uniref:IclR family transcriptional regulator n=1 Tax=Aquibium pacificus TaxID=3153579 RepID=A0ABV3SEW8_9HYPH
MPTPQNHSVVKAFGILNLFKANPGGLTLTEIAHRANLSVPTAHRFLRTLLSVGALDLAPSSRYNIGKAIQQLATAADFGGDLQTILNGHVQQLTNILNETVHIAIRSGEMVRYVAKAESSRSLKIVTRVGTELEGYCTGVGKVLLAHLPEEKVQLYVKGGNFVKLTPNTIVSGSDLMVELEAIRRQGFALDDEEFEEGLRCLAVPIAIRGTVVAAISTSGPSARIKDADLQRIRSELDRRASLISTEIRNSRFAEKALSFL